jgi:hypothetical protein
VDLQHEDQTAQRVLSPKARFQATVWTQVGGFLIFVVLLLVFPLTNKEILKGLTYIERDILLYVVGTVGIYLSPFCLAYFRECETYDELNVDIGIWLFVTLDICVLLFLVCQETGLCRSMFLPVFLLIPIAYIPVEHPEKRYRVLLVLGMIVSGMIICYSMSDLAGFSLLALLPAYACFAAVVVVLFYGIERKKVTVTRGTLFSIGLLTVASFTPYLLRNLELIRAFKVTTTDFHTSAHYRYDIALFLLSLLSILIPLMQTVVIMYQRRRINTGGYIVAEPDTSEDGSDPTKTSGVKGLGTPESV